MSRRALIGFAESLAAPEVAWSLLDAGFEVLAFTREGARPALRRCRSVTLAPIPAPERAAAAARAALASLVEEVAPAATMPLDDVSIWLLDRIAAETRVQIAGPAGEQALLALDRSRQLDAARAAGFAVPPTQVYASPAEAEAGALEFPLVVRAASVVHERSGGLARDAVRICADRDELGASLARFDPGEPLLVQPFLRGVGEGFFGLAAAAGVLAASAHHRLRMMNPEGSGSSACVSVKVDADVRGAADRLVAATGWRGLFMVELLRDHSGQPWFIELNGRPWGSMALARRTGLEYPAWALSLTLDSSFSPQYENPPAGVVCRHAGRDLVHLAHVLRGPRSRAFTAGWPSRASTLRRVVSVRRSERWYNCRRGSRMLFVTDTLDTLRTASRRRGRR